MNLTKQEYQTILEKKSPNSPLLADCLRAFLFGGLICAFGQFLQSTFSSHGLSAEHASIATPISLIFIAAFLTYLHLYEKIAKYAGAGTLVPITGFSNAIVSPAMEFKSEGYVLGLGAKLFVIAGPVLVYGISASIIYGFILYFFGGAA